MTLLTESGEFELFLCNFDTFSMIQEKPYPMKHVLKRENLLGDKGQANFNEYWYKCIVIDGNYYGFKLKEQV